MVWLVNSSLYFYPITLQRECSNRKTQLCHVITQWCQQITVKEHLSGEFALVHLTFSFCISPTDTFPFTYHPFNGPGMCAVDNLQRLRFDNSQSPDKFTGKPKIVSLRTSSQESVKHTSTFTFTFTLRTIYKVNGTARYIKRCWPATNNGAILSVLLQHKEEIFLKLTVKNRSQQICLEKMIDQISSWMIGRDCHI